MEGVSKKQIIAIRTMLAKAGIADEEEKKGFILMITDMRTDSISQMTYEEASKAHKFLKDKLIQPFDPKQDPRYKMRGKILSMAHEMQWYLPGQKKLDIKRLDRWCEKYGHGRKPFNAYTYNELPRLIRQFEKVYVTFLNQIAR